MQPLVLGLDVPDGVAAKEILEGTEVDQGLGRGHEPRVVVRATRQVLPSIEVGVGEQVRLPRILHRRLERHDEDALGPEFPGKLVGRERLPEPHLRVPQESRDGVHVLAPDGMEVGVRLVDRGALLRTHRERLVMRPGKFLASAQFRDGGQDVGDTTPDPLAGRAFEPLVGKVPSHVMVGEGGPVRPLRQLVNVDRVVRDRCRPELFLNPCLGVLRRLADFQEPGMGDIVDRIRVDAQPPHGPRREQLLRRPSHRRWLRQARRQAAGHRVPQPATR